MRVVKWKEHAPTGLASASYSTTIAEFVKSVHLLTPLEQIPPIRIMNEFLSRGACDAGMSGAWNWEPFALEPAEYLEIRSMLEANGAVFCGEPPPEAANFDEWFHWLICRREGVPFELSLPLYRKELELSRLAREEVRNGNEEDSVRYHMASLKAHDERRELLERFKQ